MLRRSFLVLISLFLLVACQSKVEQNYLIMPDLKVAIAPFVQPSSTTELLAGFIPEDQQKIDSKFLIELDNSLREKLSASKYKYTFLPRTVYNGILSQDSHGRKSILATWGNIAKQAKADIIIVPYVVDMRERKGTEMSIQTPASINMDMFLITVQPEPTLQLRSHYQEEQTALMNDLGRIGSFFKRKGSWITAKQLAEEGMDKAIKEFGL